MILKIKEIQTGQVKERKRQFAKFHLYYFKNNAKFIQSMFFNIAKFKNHLVTKFEYFKNCQV